MAAPPVLGERRPQPCPKNICRPLLRSRPPVTRSAGASCAGTGSRSRAAMALTPCWSTSAAARRRAPPTTAICPTWAARPAGSSWTPPCACGSCWTPKTTPPSRWTCWGTRPTPGRPAGPATRCAPPATRRPTPPTGRRAGRRPSSLTRRWSAWRTPMRGRPSARRSWPSITSSPGSTCAAAAWAGKSLRPLRTSRPPRRRARAALPPKYMSTPPGRPARRPPPAAKPAGRSRPKAPGRAPNRPAARPRARGPVRQHAGRPARARPGPGAAAKGSRRAAGPP